jgi:hypothetical protein
MRPDGNDPRAVDLCPDGRGSLPLKRTSFTDRHDGRVPGSFAGARADGSDDGPKVLSSRYLPRAGHHGWADGKWTNQYLVHPFPDADDQLTTRDVDE